MNDTQAEILRVMTQFLNMKATAEEEAKAEEAWERADEYRRENTEEREESDYDAHNTHWGPL